MPNFRAAATAGGSAAANVTNNVPAGTQDGDFMLFVMGKDDAGAVTWPGGWTILTEDTSGSYYTGIGWKRAAGEPANYTWNFSSIWRDTVILSYSGAITTADPVDPDPPPAFTIDNAPGNNGHLATNSITTIYNDEMLIAVHTTQNLSAWAAATSGMTVRAGAVAGVEVHVMDVLQPTAGASGTKDQAFSGTSGPIKAYLLAVRNSPPPFYAPGVQNLDARRMI